MSDTEEDGNYDDFMASDDESFQMEFESDDDEQQEEIMEIESNEDENEHVSPTNSPSPDKENTTDTPLERQLDQLLENGTNHMNNGDWEESRREFRQIVKIIWEQDMTFTHNIDLWPIWLALMNSWSQDIYYNATLINHDLLFSDSRQFTTWVTKHVKESGSSTEQVQQLEQLINDILPRLTNRFIFEINDLSDDSDFTTLLLDKIRLQLGICQAISPLSQIDNHLMLLLEFKYEVIRQWETLIINVHSNHQVSFDTSFFNKLIDHIFQTSFDDDKMFQDKIINQNLLINQMSMFFQLYIFNHLILNGTNNGEEMKIKTVLTKFQQISQQLLMISQDPRLMLLFHVTQCIYLLPYSEIGATFGSDDDTVENNKKYETESQWGQMKECRHAFYLSLQQLERLGTNNELDQSQYYQYIIFGFILSNIIIILQDWTCEESRINPFEFEQIKILEARDDKSIISTLHSVYDNVLTLNLRMSFQQLQLLPQETLNKFHLLLNQIYQEAMILRLWTKISPVYECISMHDIRIELTYDVEHMVTRDNIVTILMESKLHRQNEPYVAPFEIDFVEDHVLFPGQNFDRMRLLFTDQTIIPTTTPNLQKLDVSNKHPASRRGISSLTTAGDSSPAAFFANIKSDYQKPNDPTFTNATSLPLLQLQAAQTISKSLQMSTDNTGTNITNNPPF